MATGELATLPPTTLESGVPPLAPNEDSLYEVVDGQIVAVQSMSVYANIIAFRLLTELAQFVRQHRLGSVVMETLFILDAMEKEQRRPDGAFVSKERWPLDRQVPVVGEWQVAPDLAIEVISPSDRAGELETKIGDYFRFGVREVWVVHPSSQRIYVYRGPTSVGIVTAAQELDGGTILPGFRMTLADLFRREPVL